MGVAKASATQMSGEDLGHAYDAVRVANKSVDGLGFSSQHPEGQTTSLVVPCCELVGSCVCELALCVMSGFWRCS